MSWTFSWRWRGCRSFLSAESARAELKHIYINAVGHSVEAIFSTLRGGVVLPDNYLWLALQGLAYERTPLPTPPPTSRRLAR